MGSPDSWLAYFGNFASQVASHLSPGKAWYRDLRNIVEPPETVFHGFANRVGDWIQPLEHPLVEITRKGIGAASGLANKSAQTLPTAVTGALVQGKTAVVTCWRTGVIYACSAVAIGCYVYWVVRTRHLVVVEVSNASEMADISVLKDHFRAVCNKVEDDLPAPIPGQHVSVAAERRALEYACYKWFSDNQVRFRDVGGSRTRGEDFRSLKHICNPCLDSSDVLRQAKKPVTCFSNCSVEGQHCPQRTNFPGAIFVHSDYHMTPTDIAECVLSHSFIITHKFVGDKGIIYNEMSWEKKGITIEASTPDGTHYKHGYNLWANEGCVVGIRAACQYVRLAGTAHTDIIYLFPARGSYSNQDPQALRRASPDVKLMRGAYCVYRGDSFALYNSANEVISTGPKSFIEGVALKLGSAVRDDKYLATMQNYVKSQASAEQISFTDAAVFMDLLMEAAEKYAVEFTLLWNHRWDPLNASIFTRIILGMRRGYRRAVAVFLAPVPISVAMRTRPLNPWLFRDMVVPGYIKLTNPRRANTNNLSPGHRLFRDHQQDAYPAPDHSQHSGTDRMRREYDNEYRAASARSDRGYASRDSLWPETTDSSVNATRDPSPSKSGGSTEILSVDGLGTRGRQPSPGHMRRDCDGLSCVPGSKRFAVYCGPDIGAVLEPSLVLDEASGTGEIHSVLFNDPVILDPDQTRLVFERGPELAFAYREALHSMCPDQTFRHSLQHLCWSHGVPSPDPSEAVGQGIPADPRDGLGVLPNPAPVVRPLGKALPSLATSAAAEGPSVNTMDWSAPKTFGREEFYKTRNISQIHRSPQHLPTHRRIFSHARTIHSSPGTPSKGVSFFNQRSFTSGKGRKAQ